MTTLDSFFNKPIDALHPRLRYCKDRLAESGTSATLKVFRSESEFGKWFTEMVIDFWKGGEPDGKSCNLPWFDDLNEGLIHELKVRAVSPEHEAVRFSMGLRAGMRKAERGVGDGFFSSVLIDFLKDSDLTQYPAITDVIEHAHVIPIEPERKFSPRYETCREMIADAIAARAGELTGPLGYSREEAKGILVAALAHYLDERFQVSSRRRLGTL